MCVIKNEHSSEMNRLVLLTILVTSDYFIFLDELCNKHLLACCSGIFALLECIFKWVCSPIRLLFAVNSNEKSKDIN